MNLPAWFDGFLSPLANRSALIGEVLEKAGLTVSTLDLQGGRFVVVWPKAVVRDRRYRVKILTAHHDRVPGTPGALDNSAACLQLVNFLCASTNAFNTLAVFTDREELGGSSPADQGSYALGKALAGMGLGSPMVFPIDVTGHGDALVLSRASGGLMTSHSDGRGMAALVADTESMADMVVRMMAGRAPVYRAVVPFGEDIGFICSGLPALTITVLPRTEAEALTAGDALPAWASRAEPGKRMPETWRHLHGLGDTTALFTDEAFSIMERFLSRLASLRVPEAVA